MEESLIERRLPMAQAFWRVNQLDRVHNGGGARIGIAASGRAYLEVREALRRLGVDDDLLGRLGLRIYQVSLTWPLEAGAVEFARGLRELLVVEEKQPLIEDQFARLLYAHDSRPRLAGKRDGDGRALIPAVGELNADALVPLLARWLRAVTPDWTPPVTPPAPRELTLLATARHPGSVRAARTTSRPPFPAGAWPWAGSAATAWRRHAGAHHPGVTRRWAARAPPGSAQAPFVEKEHVFQNLGDGTFYHSGLLAVRAAVAAGVNMTYKILFNGAVAMTGGQQIEGEPSRAQSRAATSCSSSRALGVQASRWSTTRIPGQPRRSLPRDVPVHRERWTTCSEGCASVPGVTGPHLRPGLRGRGSAGCASAAGCPPPGADGDQRPRLRGLRRLRRAVQLHRGRAGGDRARPQAQHQSGGLQPGLSCLKGFCPSFVTVTGGKPRTAAGAGGGELAGRSRSSPNQPRSTPPPRWTSSSPDRRHRDLDHRRDPRHGRPPGWPRRLGPEPDGAGAEERSGQQPRADPAGAHGHLRAAGRRGGRRAARSRPADRRRPQADPAARRGAHPLDRRHRRGAHGEPGGQA